MGMEFILVLRYCRWLKNHGGDASRGRESGQVLLERTIARLELFEAAAESECSLEDQTFKRQGETG